LALPYHQFIIFPLKRSSNSFPNFLLFVFNWDEDNFSMNKRFIIVGVALGIIVVFAVIIGSPAIGGFDAMR
jgi:hypothetical protein